MDISSLANPQPLINKKASPLLSIVFFPDERYGFRDTEVNAAARLAFLDGEEEKRLKIEGSYTLNAPRERVWEVLLDPKTIAQCIPGCESMDEIGPDQYEAVMKVGVASVKGTYKGKVAIKDKIAPSHYILSGEGSGGPGFMRGDLAIDLEEQDGKTLLKYSTDAQVGGLVAAIGQRMLNGVAKMMVEQFFKKVESFL